MYIRSDVIKKGKPSLLLRKKLEMKGIDHKLLDEVFHENEEDMQEGIESKIRKDIAIHKKK
jgi:SOS response regulatory protein OraA/RecX